MSLSSNRLLLVLVVVDKFRFDTMMMTMMIVMFVVIIDNYVSHVDDKFERRALGTRAETCTAEKELSGVENLTSLAILMN